MFVGTGPPRKERNPVHPHVQASVPLHRDLMRPVRNRDSGWRHAARWGSTRSPRGCRTRTGFDRPLSGSISAPRGARHWATKLRSVHARTGPAKNCRRTSDTRNIGLRGSIPQVLRMLLRKEPDRRGPVLAAEEPQFSPRSAGARPGNRSATPAFEKPGIGRRAGRSRRFPVSRIRAHKSSLRADAEGHHRRRPLRSSVMDRSARPITSGSFRQCHHHHAGFRAPASRLRARAAISVSRSRGHSAARFHRLSRGARGCDGSATPVRAARRDSRRRGMRGLRTPECRPFRRTAVRAGFFPAVRAVLPSQSARKKSELRLRRICGPDGLPCGLPR